MFEKELKNRFAKIFCPTGLCTNWELLVEQHGSILKNKAGLETFFEDIVAEHKREMEELLSQFAFDYQIPIAHADSLMTITELVKEFLKKEGVSE